MFNNTQNINIQPLGSWIGGVHCSVDVLRLDRVHPVVSGNKWFKLRYYLEVAAAQSKSTIASFGGAYSNHLVALAFAGQSSGFKTIGLVRGDAAVPLSHTLVQARSYGMEFIFTDRSAYRNKKQLMQVHDNTGWLWVPEGGYGPEGARGASEILRLADTSAYTHILCAVGTGTMMAGLVKAMLPGQELTGISVMKGNASLQSELDVLLDEDDRQKKYSILHDYHFGGYGKHPEVLLQFMRNTWQHEQLPTDIVYTSKLLYAAKELVAAGYFPAGSRLLLVHSGGLQGNGSLPPNTLPF